MSEEIIIDGVDVSGCIHLKNDGIKKPICKSGGCRGVYKSCLCEGNSDCHFKQLKRLEQENKELKEKKDEYYLRTLDYEAKISYLIQALEEIRKQYINKAFFKCDKTEEECPCHNCIILGQLDRVQNIVKIIDEVLNDRD